MNEIKNAPFETENLEVASFDKGSGYLHEHTEQTDAVVRFTGEFTRIATTAEEDVEKNLEGLNIARELFSEIEKDYGIPTAGFSPVIGDHETFGVGAYIVSRNVKGDTPESPELLADGSMMDVIPDEQVPAAQELLVKLSTYLIDKSNKREPMLDDVFLLEQFKYENGQFVLTDMDPYFTKDGSSAFDESVQYLERMAQRVLNQSEYNDWHNKIYDLQDKTKVKAA